MFNENNKKKNGDEPKRLLRATKKKNAEHIAAHREKKITFHILRDATLGKLLLFFMNRMESTHRPQSMSKQTVRESETENEGNRLKKEL